MNCKELEQVFERNTVPTRFYTFGGSRGGDCYALESTESEWTLAYYDDRGSREVVGVFDNEDDGCRALFDAIKDMVQSAQGRTISITA